MQAHRARQVVDGADLAAGCPRSACSTRGPSTRGDLDDEPFAQLHPEQPSPRRGRATRRHRRRGSGRRCPSSVPPNHRRHDGDDVGEAASAQDLEHRGPRRARRLAVVVAARRRRVRAQHEGRAVVPGVAAGGPHLLHDARGLAPTRPARHRTRSATVAPRAPTGPARRGSRSGGARSAAYLLVLSTEGRRGESMPSPPVGRQRTSRRSAEVALDDDVDELLRRGLVGQQQRRR